MKKELITCDECGKDLKDGDRKQSNLTHMSGDKPWGDEPRPAWYTVSITLESHVCNAFEMPGPQKITGIYQFCDRSCFIKWMKKRNE